MLSVRGLFVAYALWGVVALWGSMLANGTLDAIADAKAADRLPSGRPLMVYFTGVSLVDGGLSTLIAFFDGITNGSVLASHLLLVDLVCVIQCLFIWIMVDSYVLKERNFLFRSPAIWATAWHVIGVAVILPIYCALRPKPHYYRRNCLSVAESYGFMIAAALSFTPAVLMTLPSFVVRTTHQHQLAILLYQFTPAIFTATWRAFEATGAQIQYRESTEARVRQNVSRVYIAAALTASIGHLYVLMAVWSSPEPVAMMIETFVPRPGKLAEFPADHLTAGAHLFSQYDYLITGLTCLACIYAHIGVYSLAKPTLIVFLLTASVLLGPGATLMLALWARESSQCCLMKEKIK